MKRILRSQALVCEIDRNLKPLITVKPGERFVVETEDAGQGYIRDEKTLPYPWKRPTHQVTPPTVNPVAGPIFIDGVEKDDVVVVVIEKIIPDSQGYTLLIPGEGILGNFHTSGKFNEYYTRIIKHIPGPSGTMDDGECIFNDHTRWHLTPHIGTICLSPEREILATVLAQGPSGGNLDSCDFSEGSRIFLQSYVEGGLLFIGDVHGSEGDGELTGTADETRAEVTLSCEVIKNKTIPHVRIEKEHTIIGLFCVKPLEEAVRGAVRNLMNWMKEDYGYDEREAYLLIGVCPGFRIHIYQMVPMSGLSYTAGAEIPKKYLI